MEIEVISDARSAKGRPLRVAIASAGRFHVLDLARELDALGVHVKLHSYVPRRRASSFGLPAHCHVSLLPVLAPCVAWERFAPDFAPEAREGLTWSLLNRAVIARLTECDVFICMSGIYVEAAEYAARRYGARIVLERASKHILAQRAILEREPGASLPTLRSVRRELDGYRFADMISVPSAHVQTSFTGDADALAKSVVNPYGVDIASFRPEGTRSPAPDRFTFLFVGTWSLQKGSDLLVEAIRQRPHWRLRHVGPIGDAAFPSGDHRFEHVDKVDQKALPPFYREADAFVLPSRQDGLAMVAVQALASGLPLICTTDTGGGDLCHTPRIRERVAVVQSGAVAPLVEAMENIEHLRRSGRIAGPLEAEDLQTLSWRAYGKRYLDNLNRMLAR